ncbi:MULTISPECIES: hypothetical protein [Paenibacillus]|nr:MULTISPECIES: hypothetical protein [Paenibacillus]
MQRTKAFISRFITSEQRDSPVTTIAALAIQAFSRQLRSGAGQR